MALLDAAKLALRITTDAFDSEILDLIEAAKQDLGIAGVAIVDPENALIKRAVITYVRAHFGEPDEYDRIKASYDEQKAQLGMATGFTDWEEA